MHVLAQRRHKRFRQGFLDIHEGYLCALPGKSLDKRCADARAASGDEDDFALERRVRGRV
jgi:hypothetical protein